MAEAYSIGVPSLCLDGAPLSIAGIAARQLTHLRGVSQRDFCSSFNSEGRNGGLVVQEDVVASVSADAQKPM